MTATLAARVRALFNRWRFRGLPTGEIFTHIYRHGLWQHAGDGPRSGPGSSLGATVELRAGFEALLASQAVRSIVDLGCGDFTWMSEVALDGIDYLGFDLVTELIEANRRVYGAPDRRFDVAPAARAEIGTCDLVICRDCLVHLRSSEARRVLDHILASGARMMALTHFPAEPRNRDIRTGQWRPLNMCGPPFDLPPPDHVIDDRLGQTEVPRVLAVWDRTHLR